MDWLAIYFGRQAKTQEWRASENHPPLLTLEPLCFIACVVKRILLQVQYREDLVVGSRDVNDFKFGP